MGQPTLWGQATLLQGLRRDPLTRHRAVPTSLRDHRWPSQEKADWPWDSPVLGMLEGAFAKLVTASWVLTPA